jgi:hypothetical protein
MMRKREQRVRVSAGRPIMAITVLLVGSVAAVGNAAEEKGTGENVGNVPLPICLTLVGDSSCDGKAAGDSGNGGGDTGGNLANYPVPICITAVGDAKCSGPASGDSGPSGSGDSGGNVGNAPVPICVTTVGNAECDGAASGDSGRGGKDTGGNVGNAPVPECYSVIGNVHCDGKPSGDAGDPVGTPPPAATPSSTDSGGLSVSLYIPNQRLAAVLRRGLRTELYCTTACSIKAWLFVGRRTARKLGISGAPPFVIGRKSAALSDARRSVVHVRLTPQARRRLPGARAVRMALLVKVRDAAGREAPNQNPRFTVDE